MLGPGRILRKIIDGGGRLPSLILWAGPGTGKTALDAAVPANLPDATGRRMVTEETLGRARDADDKGGEEHDNLASALVLHEANDGA